MLVPEALVVAAERPWLSQSDAIQVLLFIVALGALLWTIRETIYGGSVLKVTLELGRTDGKQMMSAPPNDFVDPQTVYRRMPQQRLDQIAVDVAIITVVNKGRTPATILQPALEFTSSGAAPVRVSSALLGGKWGEGDYRVRLEAHDSRVFTMLLQPMADAARSDIQLQKPQGVGGEIWARGIVTAGTGKLRRSPRRTRRKGLLWGDGRWKVRTPLLDNDPSPVEQLLNDFLIPGVDVYSQTVTLGSLFMLAKQGADVNELVERLDEYNIMDAGAIAMRVHTHEARADSDGTTDTPST